MELRRNCDGTVLVPLLAYILDFVTFFIWNFAVERKESKISKNQKGGSDNERL